MNDWPKISIVTPTYNQGSYIEETILSVLDQNYPNLEYIIIDGGSTDNTVEIIKKYEKYLKYWISEPDKGQSDAINKGLDHCTGEIFNWLNSDDLLLPDCLKTISKTFVSSNSDIVSGQEILFYEDGREIKKKGTLIYPTLEETIYRGVIYQPSTFWKINIIQTLTPINVDLHYLMDAHLWTSYLLIHGQKRITKINDFLIRFRLHDTSKTMSQGSEFIEQRWMLRYQLIQQILKEDSLEMKGYLKKFLRSSLVLKPFKIEKNLDSMLIQNMLQLDLLEIAYINKDYASSQRILKGLGKQLSFSNSRYLFYWLRLNLIPKFILNVLRKAKS